MGNTQDRKIEFLEQRDDHLETRDEFVKRVAFSGRKFCYVDRFGRVIWLDSNARIAELEAEVERLREDNAELNRLAVEQNQMIGSYQAALADDFLPDHGQVEQEGE